MLSGCWCLGEGDGDSLHGFYCVQKTNLNTYHTLLPAVKEDKREKNLRSHRNWERKLLYCCVLNPYLAVERIQNVCFGNGRLVLRFGLKVTGSSPQLPLISTHHVRFEFNVCYRTLTQWRQSQCGNVFLILGTSSYSEPISCWDDQKSRRRA